MEPPDLHNIRLLISNYTFLPDPQKSSGILLLSHFLNVLKPLFICNKRVLLQRKLVPYILCRSNTVKYVEYYDTNEYFQYNQV